MTRRITLGTLLVVGGLSVALAQQQAPRPTLPDLVKVRDNLYVITSSTPGPEFTGGNTGVFVTDTGVDAAFKPTGADAVYHITKDGKVTARIKNKDLGGPNGVWVGDKGSVWIVTFVSGEIYEVDAKGKKGKAHKLPKGQLDGIVGLPGGDFLVSSWEGKCVYRGTPAGEWKEVVSGIESPADIAYDPKRKRVLIPVFTGTKLEIRTLE